MNEDVEIPDNIPLELCDYILLYIPTQRCVLCYKHFKTSCYSNYPLCSFQCKIKNYMAIFYNLCMSIVISTICLILYFRLLIYMLFKMLCFIIYWLIHMF
jgi:hypothetical protein